MILKSISASRAKTFRQCQMKYHAVYELKLEDRPHPLTLMGSAVHKMFEVSTKARMAGERRAVLHDPMVLKDAAMRKFGVDGSYGPLVEELAANAVRWGYFRNVGRTVGCERKFEFLLSDGTKVTGVMDRLDLALPEADVLDLKTQKAALDEDELADNLQAKVYNAAVREMFPEVTGKVSVSFWVLRHMVQRTWLTSHDAEATKLRLAELASEIRECKDPRPSPSALCQWCPYTDCPGAKGGLKSRLRRWKK